MNNEAIDINYDLPDVIRLETSGSCNFRCRHCPNGLHNPKRGNMSVELFNTLVKQFEDCHYVPRVAVLYHGGEPLLNPNIFQFANMLKEFGVKTIKMVTNGSLFTDEKISEFLDSGFNSVEISFDGKSPEENDYIRKGAKFICDSKNVLNLIERAAKDEIKINICNVQILQPEQLSGGG